MSVLKFTFYILNVPYLQSAVFESPVERDQQELRHPGFLQEVVGPGRRHQVPDGAEGSVRQGNRGRLSAVMRHQGVLHCPVRAHHRAASHLQGGRLQRGGLLTLYYHIHDLFYFCNLCFLYGFDIIKC